MWIRLRYFLLALFAVALCTVVEFSIAADAVVLLPITGPLTTQEKSTLASDVADALAGRDQVIHGNEVERVVKQVFIEESKKPDCDETACFRRIADYFHARSIVVLRVVPKSADAYRVIFSRYDVDTAATVSRDADCDACSFARLQVLSRQLVKEATR